MDLAKGGDFNPDDYWKAIILYGLNAATYKMALAKCLLNFAKYPKTVISWGELAEAFYSQYKHRLADYQMPQQSNPGRMTKLERIVKQVDIGHITDDEAINRVASEGFKDVIPRFQTIGINSQIAADYFYEFDFGKSLVLKDNLLQIAESTPSQLEEEINARWNLLEGAFSINQTQSQYQLANDIRMIYLENGYERKSLSENVPFLQGYQGNVCFYCGEVFTTSVVVDHVLPRQVINHDEVWNLVLSHQDCNTWKTDKLVGPHFIEKLVKRNENIMGSNHPWKRKIEEQLGRSKQLRSNALKQHYEQVKSVLGNDFWGGTPGYNPGTDPFYRRLVTVLNNN